MPNIPLDREARHFHFQSQRPQCERVGPTQCVAAPALHEQKLLRSHRAPANTRFPSSHQQIRGAGHFPVTGGDDLRPKQGKCNLPKAAKRDGEPGCQSQITRCRGPFPSLQRPHCLKLNFLFYCPPSPSLQTY